LESGEGLEGSGVGGGGLRLRSSVKASVAPNIVTMINATPNTVGDTPRIKGWVDCDVIDE